MARVCRASADLVAGWRWIPREPKLVEFPLPLPLSRWEGQRWLFFPESIRSPQSSDSYRRHRDRNQTGMPRLRPNRLSAEQQANHDNTQCNPVPPKANKRVRSYIAQQPSDHRKRDYGRNNRAGQDQPPFFGCRSSKRMAQGLKNLPSSCRKHGWDADDEREFCSCRAAQSQEQSQNDRSAGSGAAGKDRGYQLSHAHSKGNGPGHLIL